MLQVIHTIANHAAHPVDSFLGAGIFTFVVVGAAWVVVALVTAAQDKNSEIE